MLLVSAGLLLRTFTRLNAIHPGFDTSHIVSGSLGFPGWKYPSADSRARFAAEVVERIRGIPGVSAAIVTGGMPPERTHIMFDIAFEIEGRGVVMHDKALIVPFSPVHDDYFSVMGIPLKAGRTFSTEDGPKAPKAIVISESMARQLWKGESPIGQRVRFDADQPWYTVVGVVGNVFQFEHARPRDQFAFYQRLTQTNETASHLVVRATGDPAPLVPIIRQAIRNIDPDQTLSDLSTSAVKYAEFFDVPRFNAWLLSSLAFVGLAIAAVGLYGVLAYTIAMRTRELGIRMALGARRADVLRLVLRNGAVVTAIGIVLGTVGSLALTRAMESMIFEVERTDPSTYVAVAVTLTIVAFVACWIPARRATRVDPVVALRCE
jgi:predicted permease